MLKLLIYLSARYCGAGVSKYAGLYNGFFLRVIDNRTSTVHSVLLTIKLSGSSRSFFNIKIFFLFEL